VNISLHIEQLVIEGLSVSQRQGELVMAALQHELGSLLAAEALHSQWASAAAVHTMQGASIRATDAVSPVRLGEQIAGSVVAGIGDRK
jgi:hypothetical protein